MYCPAIGRSRPKRAPEIQRQAPTSCPSFPSSEITGSLIAKQMVFREQSKNRKALTVSSTSSLDPLLNVWPQPIFHRPHAALSNKYQYPLGKARAHVCIAWFIQSLASNVPGNLYRPGVNYEDSSGTQIGSHTIQRVVQASQPLECTFSEIGSSHDPIYRYAVDGDRESTTSIGCAGLGSVAGLMSTAVGLGGYWELN
ncbi:hypothetical protein AG1IA_06355 [Rhizoctonia solani AG-1 IA]|uniref:Uncharacterized protein n=1 Tax=Thanatephorus cucumeris (strain AG1-IA) TaxID=983506 RepID=L8WNQ0_THACA|nr:hypothetical protein AG1IA_06355 [Rhizoctonia solani AG-1 IA]